MPHPDTEPPPHREVRCKHEAADGRPYRYTHHEGPHSCDRENHAEGCPFWASEPVVHVWCEAAGCEREEDLPAALAFANGWDFAGPGGTSSRGVISPRTCPDHRVTDTVWWALTIQGQDPDTPRYRCRWRRRKLGVRPEEGNHPGLGHLKTLRARRRFADGRADPPTHRAVGPTADTIH